MISNEIVVAIIIGLSLVFLVSELISIYFYKLNQLASDSQSIKLLKQYLKTKNIDRFGNKKDQVISWCLQHLAGTFDENYFRPQLKGNKLIVISYPVGLSKAIPRSSIYFAPTLLTALGVLGTFSGIYFGLQEISLDNLNDSEALIKASIELLEGMKGAFETSLWGLGAASILILIIAVSKLFKEKLRDRLRKQLTNISYIETPTSLLSRLDNKATQNAAVSLEKVAKNLSGLNQLNPQAIGNAVGEAIFSSNNLLLQEVKAIREIQYSQVSTVELLVKQLRDELIEPVVTRLDQSSELTKEASEAVRELKDELGGITQSLSGAVQTIQTFQKDTLDDLNKFATELQHILSNFQGETKGVLEDVSVEINRAVDKSIEGMEQQRVIFKENADTVASTFKDIHGIISDTNQVVQQELEVFREEYQNRLTEFLKDQHQELHVVVEQIRQVFQEDVEKREKLIEQIDTSMDKIQQTVKVTSNLANAIGLSDSQRLAEQQEFFRDVGKNAQQVTKHYKQMIQTLNEQQDDVVKHLNEALKNNNEHLKNYLQQTNESYAQSLQDLDRSAADVYNQLDSYSNQLIEVANYLVAATQELQNESGNPQKLAI